MLRKFVANWLREQAQQTVMRSLHPEDGAENEPAQCDALVVFPSRSEAGGMFDRLTAPRTNRCHGFVEHVGRLGERTVCLLEAAAPHAQLARVVHDVIELRQPRWIWSAGFAVALQADVRKGHMVMARRVIDDQDYSLQTGLNLDPAALQQLKGVHAGTLLTLAQLPTSMQAKSELAKKYAALACERQAAVIAEVCRLRRLPMLAVHSVAETLEAKPPDALQNIKSQSSLAAKFGAIAGAVIEQPSSVKSLWTDKETALRLSDRLAAFLVDLFDNLA